MSGTHWIVEGRIDPRWPINTRGNIGEVFPEVLTPLTLRARRQARRGRVARGLLDDGHRRPARLRLDRAAGDHRALRRVRVPQPVVPADARRPRPGIVAGCHRRGVLRRGQPAAVRTEARRQAPRRHDSDPAHRAQGVVAEVDAGTGGRQRSASSPSGRRGSPTWRRRATTCSCGTSTTTRRCSSRSSATT